MKAKKDVYFWSQKYSILNSGSFIVYALYFVLLFNESICFNCFECSIYFQMLIVYFFTTKYIFFLHTDVPCCNII